MTQTLTRASQLEADHEIENLCDLMVDHVLDEKGAFDADIRGELGHRWRMMFEREARATGVGHVSWNANLADLVAFLCERATPEGLAVLEDYFVEQEARSQRWMAACSWARGRLQQVQH